MAILVKNLKKKVLENAKESDQIIIITGYFSPDMIDEIAKMGVPFVYYYGMYGIDKIAKPVYDKLISINNSNSNLKLKFVHTQRVHTKCYLFYKNTKLENALVGSANCSINGLWNDFNKEDFDRDCDRIALVTAQISNKAQQSLRFLHAEAIGSIDAEAFMEKIDMPVFSNDDNKKMLAAIKECISLVKGCEPENEELWKFCKVFILLLFDMDCAESVNRTLSASLIKCNSPENPIFVWSRLVEYAGQCNQAAASVSKESIDRNIRELFPKNNTIQLPPDPITAIDLFIPGIDWNGNFDAKRFDYWMKTVKTWSRDNDRYEAAMHTVGLGLSYAELDEDKLPQTAVIEELNRVENDELRRGYYLGTINQRGAHWVDPEGKPELELAEDYENRANIAESRGYSRYAGILRVIADEFKREAKSNILEAKNGDDE